SLAFAMAANPATLNRAAALTIGGQPIPIVQNAHVDSIVVNGHFESAFETIGDANGTGQRAVGWQQRITNGPAPTHAHGGGFGDYDQQVTATGVSDGPAQDLALQPDQRYRVLAAVVPD